jgi:WD40 repeat protein/DNA-binding SARP family transcriptional activator
MELRVLGPVEARVGDRRVAIGAGKPRALLAMLALNTGSAVPAERLIDGLWGEEPPASAPKMLQGCVSQLRKSLAASGDGAEIVTRGRGYELRLGDGDVDARRFEELVASGSPREALALWRGPPLDDVATEPFAALEIRRLEELRLTAAEQAIERDLAAGRHAEVVPELDALVAQEPLRERLHGQRMLALYRSGRQADALEAYRRARAALVDAIGVEPGPELRRLHDAVLRQDPSLGLPDTTIEQPRAETVRRLSTSVERAAAERARQHAAQDDLASDLVELQAAREGGAPPDPGFVACPFKGLASFDVDDAPFFFGRERLVAEMVARLPGASLLGIVGPSGSGKSSALRAGLLPALTDGVLPGSDRWAIALLRPGEHPLAALKAALADVARDGRVVLAVDQFEEVFTACPNEAERTAFADALVAAMRDPRRRAVVLIALRADFYGRCASFPELWRMLGGNHVPVGPMRRDELRRAIESPARRAGLHVDPELVDALIADVEGEPGALPLLSSALLELWQQRDGRRLTLTAYEHAGGVRGAVARLAERAYERLAPEQRPVARAMLLRMAGVGEGGAAVRRRVPLTELDEAAEVLDALADDRLVTIREGEAEVAHEALFREWPRLRTWLEEDAQGRRLHHHLGIAARGWNVGGRDPAELYRGARLASAADWAAGHDPELSVAEREFLDAARTASERAHRRLQLVLAGVATLLLLALIAGGIALEERAHARHDALAAAAQRLGAQALVEDDLDRSLLLAVQGVALDDSLQTRGNLLAALLKSPAAIGVLHGDGDRMLSLALSPDGRTLAFLDQDGTLRSVDTRTRRSVAPPYAALGHELAGDRFSFDDVAYSPEGARLAVGGEAPAVLDASSHRLLCGLQLAADRVVQALRFSRDGRTVFAVVPYFDSLLNPAISIQRFDAATGRLLGPERVVSRRALAYVNLMPTRDGRRLVVASAQEPTQILDARTLEPLERLPIRADRAALSHDDRTMLVGGADGSVRFIDLDTGKVSLASGRHGAPITAGKFTADGRSAVTTSADGGAIVWGVRRPAARETLKGHAGGITGLAISRDGSTLYTAGQDSRVLIWDLAGRRRLGRPFDVGPSLRGGSVSAPRQAATGDDLPTVNPHADSVSFALRPDGRLLAIGGRDGTVSLVDAGTLLPLGKPVRAMSRGPVYGVGFAPRSNLLVVGGADGDLVTYDARARRVVRRLRGHNAAVWTPSFSRDGRLMATGSFDDTVRLWDLPTGRQVGEPIEIPTGIGDVSLSPDGKRLAVTTWPGVEIFSVATRRRVLELSGDDTVYDFARFSPDGRRIVAASIKGWTRIWSSRTGRPVGRMLGGHAGAVTSASLSPDGRTLASGSTDGTVRLYELASEKPLGTPLPGVPNRPVIPQFAPDGAHLFAISSAGRAFRWDVRPSAWRRHACAVAGRRLTRAEWEDILPGREYEPAC